VLIVGLKDAKEFKKAVINMRDATAKGGPSVAATVAAAQAMAQSQVPAYSPSDTSSQALASISTSVSHIEKMLEAMELRSHKYEKLKQVE